MKPRLLAIPLAAALVAVALTGCIRVGPVGPMSTSTPEIDDVSAVVLATSGDLTISEGDPALTIHAPEGILDQLTSEVRDGVLVLDRRPGFAPFGFAEIRYELTVPSLESLEVSGSGDVDSTISGDELTIEISGSGDISFTGVDAEAVDILISGSGEVELAGTANSIVVEIDGSGDVDTGDLEARDATVSISGSGEVEVNATDTLKVDISGSGTVRYRGGATVESEISGSGDVESDD